MATRHLRFISCGRGSAPFGNGSRLPGHATGINERSTQQHLDVGVEATEVVGRPLGQRVVDGGINSQQYLLTVTHELVVQRPGVDDRRSRLITAEHDHEIAHHGRLAFLVKIDDVSLS